MSPCVICTLTVSCDSCKVFLKKALDVDTRGSQTKDLRAVMSVCQITYLAKHMLALQNHILQKPAAFKRVRTDCLIQHISHVATSKMSEMSFALNEKLGETF